MTKKEFDTLVAKANSGDPVSQYYLAAQYEFNEDFRDINASIEWYSKAAEQNHPDALLNLGYFYDKGLFVQQNYKEAFRFYQQAAKLGNACAQYNLGSCYMYGEGVDKDYKLASEWFGKSAEQNFHYALCNLGINYLEGKGVKKDNPKAMMLLSMAAKQCNYLAQYRLGRSFCVGEFTEINKDKALYWLVKIPFNLVNTVFVDSRLAPEEEGKYYYYLGLLTYPKNYTPSMLTCHFFIKSLENLYAPALDYAKKLLERYDFYYDTENMGRLELAMGRYYRDSKMNPDMAFHYISLAVDKGSEAALVDLGDCYANDYYTKDSKLAAELYQRSASKGRASGMFRLANCYLRGIGVEQNPEKAFDLFYKAANHRHSKSQYWKALAECYLKGIGTEQDNANYEFWNKKAFSNDSIMNGFALGRRRILNFPEYSSLNSIVPDNYIGISY